MIEPMISIIIPVYNAENRLRKSIESVLNQSYRNIEVLLINDGSTDSSLEICEFYSTNDTRVKVIHQINSGVSAARNRGIIEAKGEYITFVDSDDTIDINTYEVVIDYLQTECLDMIMFGMKFDYYFGEKYSHSNIYKIKENIEVNKNNMKNHFIDLYEINYLSSVWNKVIRTSVLKENNLFFEKNMAILEDFKFVLDVLSHTDKLLALNNEFYRYYNNLSISSLSRRPNIDYLNNFRILDLSLRKFAENILMQSQEENQTIKAMIMRYYIIGVEMIFAGNESFKVKYGKFKNYIEDDRFKKSVIEASCKGRRLRIIHFLFKRKHLTSLLAIIFWVNNLKSMVK
ncbi:glycosyltransferase family 2 protein [Sporosarcina sp. G11-34]|uniref:glycosyltransferase family 2 protein n=1 Tax=Sporosarcina sp. G11-34 TaxID=2849605 RepID=UPI0022A9BA2E|nr:glycosyltransferase family 2 protein [Sporosarcina sp. G11-34]